MKRSSSWARLGILGLVLLLAFSSVAARFQATTLRGVVFNDANRNGQRDSGEAGLVDIRVQVSTSDQSYVQEYRTGDDGSFGPTLGAGTFVVKILPPDGWSVTTVDSYTATVEQGKAVTGLDFGLTQGAGVSRPATTGTAQPSTQPGTLPTTGGDQPGDPWGEVWPILGLWFIVFGAAFVALTAIAPRTRHK